MTSQATTTPLWDFADIYNLLDSFKHQQVDCTPEDELLHSGNSSAPPTPPRLPSPSQFDPKVNTPQNLGDFNGLYKFLGLPTQSFAVRSRHDSIESSGSSLSDNSNSKSERHSPESSPPSSLPDAILFDDFVDRKVRWTDEVDGTELGEIQQKTSNRKRHTKHKSSEIKNSADFDSETDIETFRHVPTLIPSWVTPQTTTQKLWLPPIPPRSYTDPTIIQPIETLTIEEKRTKLNKKIQRMLEASPEIEPLRDLHIFVDCSNIVIGFYDALKVNRGYDVKMHTKQAPLSWRSLATILERDRPVARRVLVGSNGSPHHSQPARVPDFMVEAEKLGYELNVLDRVFKYKDQTPTKKRRPKGGNGYATSGFSSGSEATPLLSRVVTEQGVDELLHMKMLESLIDTPVPGTIVLASGDAAEAEYSAGFFKNVERALSNGWNVELVAWKAGLSMEYQSQRFLNKWEGRFRLVLLDGFCEELLALYAREFLAVPFATPVMVPDGFGRA